MNKILKRVLLGAGSIVGVIVLAGAGAASYIVFAPNAADYCAHLRMLAEQEAQSNGVTSESLIQALASEESSCKTGYHVPEFGKFPWAKRVRCTVNAKSMAEVSACSGNGNRVAQR